MTANMTANMTATRNRQDHLSHQPRFSGANALAYNPQQGELDHIAARPNRGTPPRLRLVATTPRPAIVVRPRPTAAVYRRRRLAVFVAAVALVLAALLVPRPWRSWMLAGIGLSVGAAIVQQSGWPRLPFFNHNDLYHLIQAIGLFAFFWAMKNKQYDDPEGDANRILTKEWDDRPRP